MVVIQEIMLHHANLPNLATVIAAKAAAAEAAAAVAQDQTTQQVLE